MTEQTEDPCITYISAEAYQAMEDADDTRVPAGFADRVKELRARFMAP